LTSYLLDSTNAGASAGATIEFFSTVNGTSQGAQALVVTAGSGDVKFDGSLGSTPTTALASLAVNGSGTTTLAGGSVTTTGAQLYHEAVVLASGQILSGANVHFFNTVSGAQALHVTSATGTQFDAAVGTAPLTNLTTLTLDGTGTTTLNGGSVTTTGDQLYHQAVLLTKDEALTGANVHFYSTLSGAQALHVTSAAGTTFDAAVGTAPLTNLTGLTLDGTGTTTMNGGSLSTTGDQLYHQSVILTSDEVLIGANIHFYSTVSGARVLHVTSATSTTFDTVVGIAPLTSLASLTLDGSGGATIGGDVTTTGSQTYQEPLRLNAASIQIMTAGGAVLFGNTVNSAANAGNTASQNTTLTVSSGSGAITFQGAVGGGANGTLGPLVANSGGVTRFNSNVQAASLTTDAGGLTQLNGNVTTTGAQTFNDPVTLTAASNTLISTSSGNVLFANTVDGGSALTVNTAGTTIFASPVGSTTALASLTIDPPGTTTIIGGLIRTTGSQTYGDNVSLGADTLFTATANGGITFDGSLNSDAAAARNVTVTTGGIVTFGDGTGTDAVGGVHPLATLTVSGATTFDVAGTAAASPTVVTNGVQIFNGAVTLAADTVLTTLNSGNVVFNSTVDAAANGGEALTIDTTGGRTAGAFGLTQFNANVGAGAALKSLTISTGGPFSILNGITVKATGNLAVTVAENVPGVAGDDLNVQSGGTLTSTNGNVSLDAGDNLSVAGNISAQGSVALVGDYNNNDPTPGTVITVTGAIQSATVNIAGGTGTDTVNLFGTVQAANVTVNDGAGNDTFNVQTTAANTTTTINAGSGNDQVNVSSSAPNSGGVLANLAGKLVVNGGATDVLNVYDNGDTNAGASGDMTSTTITGFGMGQGIIYQGSLKTVNLLLGNGGNLVFNVHSTAASTPVVVKGQGTGTINVGNNNQIDQIAGMLDVTAVTDLNLNDQNSGRGQTYVVTNEAVGRPGTPLNVLVLYHQVGTVEVNAGDQFGSQLVDDVFNLFLPDSTDLPLSATLKLDGGVSPGGYHNTLNVVASQSKTPTGFTYHAHVGNFGSSDPIQIQNIQTLYMYGSPVDSNDLANDTNASSIIMGGINADTLSGGSGQDVIFGGGDTASTGDLLNAGTSSSDFVFAEFSPQFNSDGSVSFIQATGNGNTTINAGGGAAVTLTPNTNINNASSVIQVSGRIDVVTWLTARFAAPSSLGSIFQQALASDPVLTSLQAPPGGPAPVPVALTSGGSTSGGGGGTPPVSVSALDQYVNSAFEDILGRAPDTAALASWSGQLSSGLTHKSFAAALTHSDEYYANEVITPAYEKYLGRAPDASGLTYWTAQLRNGLTDEQLEAGFIASAEFYATQGGGTDPGWIDALYVKLLGRPADPTGKQFWLTQLANGETHAQVAFAFTHSLERERTRVAGDYDHYLHRLPDQQGIDYWVNQFAQGLSNEDLIAGFVASDEYFSDNS
ncbi:MAG TPA: DUF4214 domain-containing protein, partial [Pirellulales bacterium]|nr:DUF4214 domain-containing protein [Pirellulales bacterium]